MDAIVGAVKSWSGVHVEAFEMFARHADGAMDKDAIVRNVDAEHLAADWCICESG